MLHLATFFRAIAPPCASWRGNSIGTRMGFVSSNYFLNKLEGSDFTLGKLLSYRTDLQRVSLHRRSAMVQVIGSPGVDTENGVLEGSSAIATCRAVSRGLSDFGVHPLEASANFQLRRRKRWQLAVMNNVEMLRTTISAESCFIDESLRTVRIVFIRGHGGLTVPDANVGRQAGSANGELRLVLSESSTSNRFCISRANPDNA